MDKLLEFLSQQRVAALTLQISDSELHPAAMHYSHSAEPLQLFFSTRASSEKAKGILNGKSVPAGVVVGFSEEDWITAQMRGSARLVTDEDEKEKVKEIHYAKNPHSKKYADDPDTAFIVVEITWWRYGNLGTKPPEIISSAD